MKKNLILVYIIIFFILMIYSINYVSSTDNYLSPSGSTSVKVNVDSDAPIIQIFSPQNTAYNNQTPLLVNFSVFDNTLDSIWYSLNDISNITINNPFTIQLAEGTYKIKIYANDSFNRVNFSEITFSINNSNVYCGNAVCDSLNGESCNNCLTDCGLCPSQGPSGASGGGGGGGGGVNFIEFNKKNFAVDKDKIKISLNQGETKSASLLIRNIGNKKIFITINSDSGNLASISQNKFYLNIGESKIIQINFKADENTIPDLYLVRISIIEEDTKEDILTSIEVNSKNVLFDVKVEIPEKYLVIKPGNELLSNIEVINLGDNNKRNISLEYIIKDAENKTILQEKENLEIENQINFIKKFNIPKTTKAEAHILYVKASYKNSVAIASAWFLVEKSNLWIFIIIILILLLIAVLIILNKKGLAKKSAKSKNS